ncbi:MAG: hypothetical protein E7253_00745 [Lachnospiraceae bacterium]|nr:hypothetical protein [Lachnospiraceae bacterium]
MNNAGLYRLNNLKEIMHALLEIYHQDILRANEKDYRQWLFERYKDTQMLLLKCEEFCKTEKFDELQIILKHYASLINIWEQECKEKLSEEIESYKQHLNAQRKKRYTGGANIPLEREDNYRNFITDEKAEEKARHKYIRKFFEKYNHIYMQIGYSSMIDGLRAAVSITVPDEEINMNEEAIQKIKETVLKINKLLEDAKLEENKKNTFYNAFSSPLLCQLCESDLFILYPEIKTTYKDLKGILEEYFTEKGELGNPEKLIKAIDGYILHNKESCVCLLTLYIILNMERKGVYTGEDLLLCDSLLEREICSMENRYCLAMCRSLSMIYQDYSVIINWLNLQMKDNLPRTIDYSKIHSKTAARECLKHVLVETLFSPIIQELSLYQVGYFSGVYNDTKEDVKAVTDEEGINIEVGNNKDCMSKNFCFPYVLKGAETCIELQSTNALEQYVSLVGFNVCVAVLDGLDGICIYKDNYQNYREQIDLLMEQVARYIGIYGSCTEILIRKLFEIVKKTNDKCGYWKFTAKNSEPAKECIHWIIDALKECPIEMFMKFSKIGYFTSVFPGFMEWKEQQLQQDLVIRVINCIYSNEAYSQCSYLQDVLSEVFNNKEKYLDSKTLKEVETEVLKYKKEKFECMCKDKFKISEFGCLNRKISEILETGNTVNYEYDKLKASRRKLLEYEIEVKESIRHRVIELRKAAGWNEFFINNEVFAKIQSEISSITGKSGRPTNKRGRWYCFLQKALIEKLNQI